MTSLRSRLVLGVLLAAVLPPAIVTWLLAGRIQQAVRGQARERLAASLEVARSGLAADAARMEARLEVLARDPEIRRLLLVRPDDGGALAAVLAERRALLGFDRLAVTDAAGALAADAASSPWPGRGDSPAVRGGPWPARDGAHQALLVPLEGRPAAALMAAAPIRYRNDVAGLVLCAVRVDSAYLAPLARASGLGLVLRSAGGPVIVAAMSDAAGLRDLAAVSDGAGAPANGPRLARTAALAIGPPPHLEIVGVASTASADAAIGALRTASIALGALGVALGIGLGAWWSWQLARPVERLAAFAQRMARGEWDEPLAAGGVRELASLVDALDRMRDDLRRYRGRLIESERHAAWSQMARMVAHEVKNPLTPIAVSIADLERSYAQRRPDFAEILAQAVRIVGAEIGSLKRLLHEFSELGRLPEPRFAPLRAGELLDDLAALYAAEAAAGRMVLARPAADAILHADRGLLRQALVNLVKNALEAIGGDGCVTVAAAVEDGSFAVRVSDTGPGLDREAKARLFVPHTSAKPGGSGLGLAIVARIVSDHGGSIAAESEPGRGTTIELRLPLAGGAI
jgi:nitrogen fixation/metabolism regulation signal transduction histidine kinase